MLNLNPGVRIKMLMFLLLPTVLQVIQLLLSVLIIQSMPPITKIVF